MYSVIVFMGFALTVIWADSPDVTKCLTLVDSEINCCQRISIKANASEVLAALGDSEDDDLVKECMDLPQNCSQELCFAQKLGYATPKGTMDKKPAQDMIETEFSKILEPEVVAKIVKNCVNGDMSVYGSEEVCDFVKLGLCTDMQILLSCSKWDDDSSCSEMKNLVNDCKTIIPN